MSHRKTETTEPELGAVRVRPARDSDLPSVIALDAENTGIPKASYWKDRFDWYAGRQPDRFFLVAERDTTLVGFIVGEVRAWEFGSPPSGWVFALGVSESARLAGLGTMLFEGNLGIFFNIPAIAIVFGEHDPPCPPWPSMDRTLLARCSPE